MNFMCYLSLKHLGGKKRIIIKKQNYNHAWLIWPITCYLKTENSSFPHSFPLPQSRVKSCFKKNYCHFIGKKLKLLKMTFKRKAPWLKKNLQCVIVCFLKQPVLELRSIMVVYAPDNSPNAQAEWPCVWMLLSTFYRSLLQKAMRQWNLLMYTRCPKQHWNSFSEERGWTLFSLFLQQPSHSQHYFPLWISLSTGEQPRQGKELFRAPKQTVLQNSLCKTSNRALFY